MMLIKESCMKESSQMVFRGFNSQHFLVFNLTKDEMKGGDKHIIHVQRHEMAFYAICTI